MSTINAIPQGGGFRSFRRDGSNVPGNQPGGANGMFGRYGQIPDQQPSQSAMQTIGDAAKGWAGSAADRAGQNLNNSPAGQLWNRYGTQGRTDHAMNQNMQQMQDQSGANSKDRLSRDPYPRPDGYGMHAPSGISEVSPVDQQQPADMGSEPGNPMPQSGGYGGGDPQQQPEMMARGGIITKPTLALLGEHEPEAVVPMGGNPNARITPGMVAPRNDIQTGESSLIHPLHNLKPTSGPLAQKPSGWKRWHETHSMAR